MQYFWWTLFQSRNRSRVKIFIFQKAWIYFLFIAGLFCNWVCICLDKMVASCTACTSYFLCSAAQLAVSNSHNIAAHFFYWRVPCKGPLWSNSLFISVLPPRTLSTPPIQYKEVEGRKMMKSLGRLKEVTILNVYVTANQRIFRASNWKI